MSKDHYDEETLYHYRLDEKEGQIDSTIQSHLAECHQCMSIYKGIKDLNSAVGQIQNHQILPENDAPAIKPEGVPNYEFQDVIGQGGMGTIWKAWDSILHRHVAIKVIRANFIENQDFCQRLQREAKLLTQVNHQNIVQVYNALEHDGQTMIVMEYIEGHDLRNHVAEQKPEFHKVYEIFKQILEAIQAAHAKGILHRDIKCSNVMIRKDGQIKVLDFGLAKSFAQETVFTTENAIVGTVGYMAPEIIQGGKASIQSDIYALGILFYELIKPRVNQGDSSFYEFINTIRDQNNQSITSLPSPVKKFIIKMCENSVEHRYQSIEEIQRDLNKILFEIKSPILNKQEESTQILLKKGYDDREVQDIISIAHELKLKDENTVGESTLVEIGAELEYSSEYMKQAIKLYKRNKPTPTHNKSQSKEKRKTWIWIPVSLLIILSLTVFFAILLNDNSLQTSERIPEVVSLDEEIIIPEPDAPFNRGETNFYDHFNRPNSSTVGNNWINLKNQPNTLSIYNNKLVNLNGNDSGFSGVYRSFKFDEGVHINADLTHTYGYADKYRYEALFFAYSNGEVRSGYGISVLRTEAIRNNSQIILIQNGVILERQMTHFQFKEKINIGFNIYADGRIVGSVRDDKNVQNFAFDPRIIQKAGNQFSVQLSNGSNEGQKIKLYPSIDNLDISSIGKISSPNSSREAIKLFTEDFENYPISQPFEGVSEWKLYRGKPYNVEYSKLFKSKVIHGSINSPKSKTMSIHLHPIPNIPRTGKLILKNNQYCRFDNKRSHNSGVNFSSSNWKQYLGWWVINNPNFASRGIRFQPYFDKKSTIFEMFPIKKEDFDHIMHLEVIIDIDKKITYGKAQINKTTITTKPFKISPEELSNLTHLVLVNDFRYAYMHPYTTGVDIDNIEVIHIP